LSTSDNYLGIDWGTKRVGIAIYQNGLISPLGPIKNTSQLIDQICTLAKHYQVSRVYVGLSTGPLLSSQMNFVSKLSAVIKSKVETVDETATTIEAEALMKANSRSKKVRRQHIDSVSAALILTRVTS